MPIYAYRCSACGHAQDVLQKMSDPKLTDCPACGQATYVKQVTAAGFQLKGSGWYVTDFREGNKGGAKDKSTDAGDKSGAGQSETTDKAATASDAGTAASGADTGSSPTADKPAAKSKDAPAPAPASTKATPPPSST